MKKSFPIFGILVELSSSAKIEAGTQLFINVLFSTAPIWLVTFIFSVQNWILASDKTYFQALLESLHKAISNGELLMYAVAALGPLIQVSNKYSRDRTEKPFPNLRPILVVAFVVVSMATGLFFMTRNSSTSSHISIIAISAVIYFVSLMILFPLLAFDCEKMKNPSDALMQDESEFQDGYGAHRSSK